MDLRADRHAMGQRMDFGADQRAMGQRMDLGQGGGAGATATAVGPRCNRAWRGQG